jgi:hypothetical protein
MTGHELINSLWMILVVPGSMAGIYCLLKFMQFISDAGFTRFKQFRWEHRNNYDYKNSPPWREWYAWRPVKTISGQLVWLDTVYRMVGNTYSDQEDMTWYYYGTIMDVLKDTQ